ncbi:MAG: hypothetical protein ABW199_00120 [Caulobacterales bacterium]
MIAGLAIAALLLIAAALTLPRLIGGPTLYDRALAVHALIFILALAGAAIGASIGVTDWIFAAAALIVADLALAIAVLKFFRHRSLQPPLTRLTPLEERDA